MTSPEFQQKSFLLLLILVTLAFFGVLLPFYDAVFWGVVLAVLFSRLYNRLLAAFGRRRNAAALATVLICLLIVVLPLILVGVALVEQGMAVYARIESGQINFGAYIQHMIDSLPGWIYRLLARFGLTDVATLTPRLTNNAAQGSQAIAKRAFNLGQNTFEFLTSFVVMLYLLFFLLRDGAELSGQVLRAIPLDIEQKRQLIAKFTAVIRATVKGNLVVAAVQGALGGMMFALLGIPAALLWGALMALLSLLPAIGAALVWGPAALHLIFTGSVWQGVALIVFGVLVVGLVDNFLRPLLVGKDTQMPDYVVLISTLGGMSLFGLNGFVIGPVVAALFIAVWDLFASAQRANG